MQLIMTHWCSDKPCIITTFPLRLNEEEHGMWTRFTKRLINESSFQHFLKSVNDIKNEAINRRVTPISKTLSDVYPPILGAPLIKSENKTNK
jgi:hypothetical protein